MTARVDFVSLAGLLHDVGKLVQRADTSVPGVVDARASELGAPTPDGKPTHVHALSTHQAVAEWTGDSRLASVAASHHRPIDDLDADSLCVLLGDWCAAGERVTGPELPVKEVRVAPLLNIFDLLASGAVLPGASARRQTGRPLPVAAHTELFETAGSTVPRLFPNGGAHVSASDYARLVAALRGDVARFARGTLGPETWFHLIRQYTVRVPAATPTASRERYSPDISLFDHSRVVAAVAGALAATGLDETSLRELARSSGEAGAESPRPLQLVCGDLSGIQRFLYTLRGRGAARGLRGRSFFLQFLTEAVSRWVAARAGVTSLQILYCGGGRFYLLAPSTFDARTASRELNAALLDEFRGALRVPLAGEPFGLADARAGQAAALWARVGSAVREERERLLGTLARDRYEDVFGPFGHGGVTGECETCRDEVDGSDECELCRWLGDLGRALRKGAFLIESAPAADVPDPRPLEKLLGSVEPIEGEEALLRWKSRNPGRRIERILQLNDFDLASLALLAERGRAAPGQAVEVGYRSLGLHTPRLPTGEIVDFESLATRHGEVPAGKLGVLRADVDDLGRLFREGFGGEGTFARIATLSRSLSDFFEGYVNQLVERDAGDLVQVVYSGGDDLFLVGEWGETARLAGRLSDDFRSLSGLSLSAGVALVEARHPIRAAARLAGEHEDASKRHHRAAGPAKNALTILGRTLGFEELPRFASLATRLVELDPTLGRGFLRALMDLHSAYLGEREALRRERGLSLDELARAAHWGRWRWMLVYSLRDYVRGHTPEVVAAVDEIQKDLLERSMEERLDLALRWAELRLRAS